jgi:hypothetical protein
MATFGDWLREKLGFKFDRADTFPSSIQRAKDEGYLCGLFTLAVGKVFTRV